MANEARGYFLTDEAFSCFKAALEAATQEKLTDGKLASLTGLAPNTAGKIFRRKQPVAKSSFHTAFSTLKLDFDPLRDLADSPYKASEQQTAPRSKAKPTPAFAELRKNYLDFLIRRHSTVDPRGIMQTERGINLPLDEVYVSLTAEKRTAHVREYLPHDFSESEDGDDVEDLARERWDRKQEMAVRSVPVELDEALRGHARLIFLGDPGAGKTTLLRYLALKFAQAQKDGLAEVTDNEGRIYGVAKLPILVRVSEFADAFSKDRTLSVRDFLPRCHCGDLGISEADLKAFYEAELSTGNALILLDGLDEVVSAADRAEIGRRIDSFVTGLAGAGGSGNRVVVTSRIMGYREAALSAQFEEHTLRDMSIEQIERFLLRWCPAYEKHRDPNGAESERQKRAEEEAKALLETIEANEGVKRLATNPLLLTILLLIRRNVTYLPKRRVELYEIASKTLLRDWQIGRGIQEDHLVQPEEARELLAPLAYWMHCHEPTGLIEERDARDVLARVVMRTRGLKTKHEAEKFVTDFLRRVREHTGIFVERAPGKYGFMHLTFEEYFAALYLVDNEDEIVIERIANLKHHPRWEEPIRLAIAQERHKRASKFIRRGILEPQSDYEKWLQRDLILSGCCLHDCTVIGELIQIRDLLIHRVLAYFAEAKKYLYEFETIDFMLDFISVFYCDDHFIEMKKLIEDEDSLYRSTAVEIISRMDFVSGELLGLLYYVVEYDDCVYVRHEAARILIKYDFEFVFSALLKDLNNNENGSDALGIIIDGKQDKRVLDLLIDGVNHTNEGYRCMVASGLAEYKNAGEVILDNLKLMLDDPSTNVKLESARALCKIGNSEPLKYLCANSKPFESFICARDLWDVDRSYSSKVLLELCMSEKDVQTRIFCFDFLIENIDDLEQKGIILDKAKKFYQNNRSVIIDNNRYADFISIVDRNGMLEYYINQGLLENAEGYWQFMYTAAKKFGEDIKFKRIIREIYERNLKNSLGESALTILCYLSLATKKELEKLLSILEKRTFVVTWKALARASDFLRRQDVETWMKTLEV